jgi:hypothetical protein
MKLPSIAGLVLCGVLLLCGVAARAQAPAEPFPPTVSVKQLMLDLIHPSSNDILLAINRGTTDRGTTDRGTNNPNDWPATRRAAVTLAESGNLLMQRGRFREGDWMKDAKLLVDAGNAAYKAAQAKDLVALAAVGPAIDASCTACHKQYRPNVFPKVAGVNGTGDGGLK